MPATLQQFPTQIFLQFSYGRLLQLIDAASGNSECFADRNNGLFSPKIGGESVTAFDDVATFARQLEVNGAEQ